MCYYQPLLLIVICLHTCPSVTCRLPVCVCRWGLVPRDRATEGWGARSCLWLGVAILECEALASPVAGLGLSFLTSE